MLFVPDELPYNEVIAASETHIRHLYDQKLAIKSWFVLLPAFC